MLFMQRGFDMNTQNDADNAADFEALRKAIALKCYNICLDLAQEKYDEYKGRGRYKADNPFLGNPHTEGLSDGASECAQAILDAFKMEQP